MTNIEKERSLAMREAAVGVSGTADTAADAHDARHALGGGPNSSALPVSEGRPAPAGDARPVRVPRRRLSRRNLLL